MQLLQPDYKLSLLQVALRIPTMEHLVEAGLLTPKGEPNLEPQYVNILPTVSLDISTLLILSELGLRQVF